MQSDDETIALALHHILDQVAFKLSRMYIDQCFYNAAIVLGYNESVEC